MNITKGLVSDVNVGVNDYINDYYLINYFDSGTNNSTGPYPTNKDNWAYSNQSCKTGYDLFVSTDGND